MLRSLFCVLLAAVSTPAFSMVVEPHTPVGFRIDRPQGDYIDGSVDLDRLRAHHCVGGGYTDFVANTTVDPVEGATVTITTGGDYCTFTWMFDSDIELDGSAFTVTSTAASVDVTVSTSMGWVAVPSWSVTGTMPGNTGPFLTTWLE